MAKKVNPDEVTNTVTMHNMSIVIDQVEPHLMERLDLDLGLYGWPTSLNHLVSFEAEEVKEMN